MRIMILLLASLVALSCIPRRTVELGPVTGGGWQKEWDRYYRFLEGVADGADFKDEQLFEALDFFRDTTGISFKLDGNAVGPIVDQGMLRLTLKRWALWREEQLKDSPRS